MTLDQYNEAIKGILAEQQKIADAFSDAGLLPRSVDTGDVVLWKPEQLK